MWTVKGTEVVWEDEPKRKIADRPHRLTLLIGLLSPALALVSLFFASRALKTSQQAMEIGQQAYLSLDNPLLLIETSASGILFKLSGNIINSGNTPATITNINVIDVLTDAQINKEFSSLKRDYPYHGNLLPFLSRYINAYNADIGPKSKSAWQHQEFYMLPPGTTKQFTAGRKIMFVNVGADNRFYAGGPLGVSNIIIEYLDAFSKTHTKKWYWVEDLHSDVPRAYPGSYAGGPWP